MHNPLSTQELFIFVVLPLWIALTVISWRYDIIYLNPAYIVAFVCFAWFYHVNIEDIQEFIVQDLD